MIGKKIGTYSDIFTLESPVNGYAIKAIFEREKMEGGGSTKLGRKDVEETTKFVLQSDVNVIMIKYEQNKLVVDFGVYKIKEGEEMGFISTKATFAIDIETQDVYNSQY